MNRPFENVLRPLLIAAVFVALLYPYFSDYVAYHPDERHYTNAAITMVQTGDWLTPKYPDGTDRFNKPPLTYWAIASSYSLFGINPLSSRLPFALIAAAIILLTFWLAKRLTGRSNAGWLAGWIIASNLLLLQGTGRAIPDLPLTLFLLLSAAGWLCWMTARKPERWMPWAAYVGAGLAVASKGLPAMVFVGLTAAFALVNPWRRLGLLQVLNVPAILAGAMLGLGWFIAMYAIHGDAMVAAFFHDQVGKRVDSDFAAAVVRGLMALLAMILGFLPWLWPARRTLFRFGPAGGGDGRSAALTAALAGIWAVTMLFMMAEVVKFHARYMLPVLPLLAISLAIALDRTDERRLQRWLDGALYVTLGINLLLLATLATLLYLLEGFVPVWQVLLIVLLTGLIGFAGIVGSRTVGIATLASAVMLLFTTAFTLLKPALLPEEGEQIAEALRLQGIEATEPVGGYVSPRVAAKIRVGSGGDIRIVERSIDDGLELGDAAVVLPERYRDRLEGSGYVERAAIRTWDSLPRKGLWDARDETERERLRSENAEVYVIAVRRDTQSP